MNLQTPTSPSSSYSSAVAANLCLASVREPFSADRVVLRHLKTPAEIASVLDLREEIDLSVHAAAGPQFETVEKKETKSGLSSASTWMASASAPSASFRWATA